MTDSELSQNRVNRLLSLDGGGVQGIFTLAVLERIESILASRTPALCLTDYFNFIGGTSTGAIVATLLSRGMTAKDLIPLYLQLGPDIFRLNPSFRIISHLYCYRRLAKRLKSLLRESDGSDALLGSQSLKTFLLLVMRNGTTGSLWPLTNHPNAKFNRRDAHGASNLDFPLWRLLRASSAAPTYFASEEIAVPTGDGQVESFEFIDGGVGPYNNPALAMFLHATLPAYAFQMPTGIDRLTLVSIGVGRQRLRYPKGSFRQIHRFEGAIRTLMAMMDASSLEQDKLCRVLGACRHGAPLDLEIGDLRPATDDEGREKAFAYYRFDHQLTDSDRSRLQDETRGKCRAFGLDQVRCMPTLLQIGREYAERAVRPEYFPEGPWGSELGRPSRGDISEP